MTTATGIEHDVDPLLLNSLIAHCCKIEREGSRQ